MFNWRCRGKKKKIQEEKKKKKKKASWTETLSIVHIASHILGRTIHKEIPLMKQTPLWEHKQETGVINQKGKGT